MAMQGPQEQANEASGACGCGKTGGCGSKKEAPVPPKELPPFNVFDVMALRATVAAPRKLTLAAAPPVVAIANPSTLGARMRERVYRFFKARPRSGSGIPARAVI